MQVTRALDTRGRGGCSGLLRMKIADGLTAELRVAAQGAEGVAGSVVVRAMPPRSRGSTITPQTGSFTRIGGSGSHFAKNFPGPHRFALNVNGVTGFPELKPV